RRKPLSAAARRAGWVGCNILLSEIPKSGRIALIERGNPRPKAEVLRRWAATKFVSDRVADASKGWLLATMRVVDHLGVAEFNLADVYAHELEFLRLYPNNRNVRPKLRQQLQRLRDAGYIEFLGAGRYRRCTSDE
ncbi:MAG: hypothetical protein JOZ05_12610, partial [Acetobacteraceae bacterium]|nr:hypothetical protein [Acetobacteraceae bacterium]